MRIVILALCAATFAGCAGGETRVADSAAGDVDSAVRGAFVIGLSEWKVDVPLDTLPAGTYTFRIENTGSRDHGLAIEGNGREWKTGDIDPGQASELSVELEPGSYEFYCPVEDSGAEHEARGMKRMLIIKAA